MLGGGCAGAPEVLDPGPELLSAAIREGRERGDDPPVVRLPDDPAGGRRIARDPYLFAEVRHRARLEPIEHRSVVRALAEGEDRVGAEPRECLEYVALRLEHEAPGVPPRLRELRVGLPVGIGLAGPACGREDLVRASAIRVAPLASAEPSRRER